MYDLNVIRLHNVYTNIQYKYEIVGNQIFKNINTNIV